MAADLLTSLAEGCQNLWSDLTRQAVATGQPTSHQSGRAPNQPATQSRPAADPVTEQSAAAADEQVTAPNREAGELECPCDDKWLVITITRHTKHNFGGRWDCTVGDLKMELWETEDAGSGQLVFECDTSERGGPAVAAFDYDSNGEGYTYHNQYMIVARESYGLSPHSTTNYKTYGYNTAYLAKPRPGIAIYGTGPGSMDRRSGVLMHPGTQHTWSVGCIVLHRDGAVSGGAFQFNKDVSVNAMLEMLEKIHTFAGKSKLSNGVRIDRVRLRILEEFDE